MDDNLEIATSDEELSQEDQSFVAQEVDEETPHEPGSLQDELEKIYNAAEKKDVAEPEVKEAPEEVAAPEENKEVEPAKPSKAPASWKTDAKQVFDTLPETAQAEIMRREQEINTTLAQTANERKLATAYMNTASKYESMYQARGINSLQAAEQLFEADRLLSTGTRQERANVLAELIQQYGVGQFGDEFFNDIDSVLVNKAKQPQIDPALNQRLSQVEQFARQQQEVLSNQQRFAQEEEQKTINSNIEQFRNDPKNEFFEQVRNHMGVLLSGNAAKDLADAYEQACYANPEVRKVLLQREQQNRQRVAAGTSTLPTKGPRNGPPPPKAQVKDRQAYIASLFEEAGGRV